jgi:histone H3/H4
MGKISKSTIKKIVNENHNSGLMINAKAADAIAKILEKKADKIAKYAVARAKKKGRNTITDEDIDAYKVRFGD